MNSQAKAIEELISRQPENKILTANQVYSQLPESFSEQAFYQTLTRLTQRGELCHLTKGLYYRPRRSRFGVVPLGEQNIIDHYTENGQGMVIGYRLYHHHGLTTPLEILQNYRNIEDINRQQMAEYMKKFALNYSEEAILTVLSHRNYKKSTIAFLVAFLGFWNTKHTLQQYLSRLSTYAIPQMEEFYAST